MLWLGLLTLSITIFVIECLFFIFGLQFSYDTGLGLALLNAAMGFSSGIIAHMKRRPAETWLLYGAVAWPVALIHALSIPPNKEMTETRLPPGEAGDARSSGVAALTPIEPATPAAASGTLDVEMAAPSLLPQEAFTAEKAA